MLVSIDKKVSRFCFATNLQRISSDIETAEFLMEQFSIMMESINIEEWRHINMTKEASNDVCSTWLR